MEGQKEIAIDKQVSQNFVFIVIDITFNANRSKHPEESNNVLIFKKTK